MHTVVVVGTGGTIATRRDADGANRAADDGAALVSRLGLDPTVAIRTHDAFVLNSFVIGPREMLDLAHAVQDALADPAVAGVVVTHGTDTMEESAYLLDLVHRDERPVVLTGAQRAADAPDSDGVCNLTDAITVAADPRSRGIGVVICFDGLLFPARLTRKTQTLRPAAFSTPDAGPLGQVGEGRLVLQATPVRTKPLDLNKVDLSGVRVDIAAFYPGADSTALRAFVAAGATGLVLEASGAGNANPEFVETVAELTQASVVVGLSTRVDAGPVAAIYGNGGGADLVTAGAVPVGSLRAPQARVLLTVLLGSLHDPDRVRAALPGFIEI